MKVVVVDGVYIRAIFLGKLGTERVEKDSVVGARIFIQRLMDKGLDLGWIKDIKVGRIYSLHEFNTELIMVIATGR